MTTASTLAIFAAIAALKFGPMTPADFGYFGGADADAQIATGTPQLITALGWAIAGEDVMVVASGDRIEAHGIDADGGALNWTLIGESLL